MSKRRGGARRTSRTRGGGGWSYNANTKMVRDVVRVEDASNGLTLVLTCGHRSFTYVTERSRLPKAVHCFKCESAVRVAARDVTPASKTRK